MNWSVAERHARYHKIATWIRWCCILALVPEVYEAFKLHFPLWDDISMPMTVALDRVAAFVQRHSEMYRID